MQFCTNTVFLPHFLTAANAPSISRSLRRKKGRHFLHSFFSKASSLSTASLSPSPIPKHLKKCHWPCALEKSRKSLSIRKAFLACFTPSPTFLGLALHSRQMIARQRDNTIRKSCSPWIFCAPLVFRCHRFRPWKATASPKSNLEPERTSSTWENMLCSCRTRRRTLERLTY